MEIEEERKEPVGENTGQERGMRGKYDQRMLYECMEMSYEAYCFILLTYANKNGIFKK